MRCEQCSSTTLPQQWEPLPAPIPSVLTLIIENIECYVLFTDDMTVIRTADVINNTNTQVQ